MDYESRAVALDRNELDTLQIRRIPVLNGLVNEYTHAA